MLLLYVISQGHSGSTLLDSILGTHPDFISSGELRYLQWQLYRTQDEKLSIEKQNICTCGRSFRDCDFWSKVIKCINERTGKNISQEPFSLKMSYFNMRSYKNRGGLKRTFLDKVREHVFIKLMSLGLSYKYLRILEPNLKEKLKNNWILYQCMSEVAQKDFVVDSSKTDVQALLLQQYKPLGVHFIFIHRSPLGLAASYKRILKKSGAKFKINNILKKWGKFEKKVSGYKQHIKNLNYIDVNYEDFVRKPTTFLKQVVVKINANTDFKIQSDDKFYIDPEQKHMVAGNPMRYIGKQQVKYDERWKNELTKKEIQEIEKFLKTKK